MKIPKNYQEIILNEFKDVLKLCDEANSIDDKLYFFSASFGIINRIMNLHYDPILISMHQALQTVHQGISQRLANPRTPGSISNNLPIEMLNSLFLYFSDLILAFEKQDEDEIRKILEKFTVLWYATSGNGYYLYLRGKLKI